MFPPEYSPWGEVQHQEKLCSGVFSVSTASHGGIMVHRSVAKAVLSPAARKHCFRDGSYYCFEEDCAATVALRELMDKKLFAAPVNDYWKPGEYEACINDSVRRYYPDYWKAREAAMIQKQQPNKNQTRKTRGQER